MVLYKDFDIEVIEDEPGKSKPPFDGRMAAWSALQCLSGPRFPSSRRIYTSVGTMRLRRLTAKMNDIDPQAWLADVLARIAEHPVQRLDELLPWSWRQLNAGNRQAA